jgi:cardiolipin synthase
MSSEKVYKSRISRASVMIVIAISEFLIGLLLITYFGERAGWAEALLRMISFVLFLYIVRSSRHLSADIMWIMLILLFPVPATVYYVILNWSLISNRTYKSLRRSTMRARICYTQDPEILSEAAEAAGDRQGQIVYLSQFEGFPVYRDTGVSYYPLGEDSLSDMLEALAGAENFIFMEYFIIKRGSVWEEILKILRQKVKEGLDVRVMYDDMGSINSIPKSYAKQLEKEGISCVSFNRISPILSLIMNHRDHRKILVIDGKIGFTGGINIADEYYNRTHPYGEWKDNCIRVTGEAVWSMTVMFLTMWNAVRKEDDDFRIFRVHARSRGKKTDGYIIPYADTPLDRNLTGQYVYTNILNQAQRYVYIFTPYLIIDNEMTNALTLAAQRGVDVRIVTPGIPDKKVVYGITRSYYKPLISCGVRIFEYTPGFVHSKVFVCDDMIATVGTINLDYRSLFLHFENGIYLYGSREIPKIRQDLTDAMERSREITEQTKYLGLFENILISIVRPFAPLL